MLGHGDVLNADVITAVEQVQLPAADGQGAAQLIAQMRDAHPVWQALSVSCGLDHSAAVVSISDDDVLARYGAP